MGSKLTAVETPFLKRLPNIQIPFMHYLYSTAVSCKDSRPCSVSPTNGIFIRHEPCGPVLSKFFENFIHIKNGPSHRQKLVFHAYMYEHDPYKYFKTKFGPHYIRLSNAKLINENKTKQNTILYYINLDICKLPS